MYKIRRIYVQLTHTHTIYIQYTYNINNIYIQCTIQYTHNVTPIRPQYRQYTSDIHPINKKTKLYTSNINQIYTPDKFYILTIYKQYLHNTQQIFIHKIQTIHTQYMPICNNISNI